MILIKLGGSVITNKSKDYTFKTTLTRRLLREIDSSLDENYIIVHGGGSFGHPGAEKYRLNSEEPQQIARGTAEVQLAMRRLNNRVIKTMLEEDIYGVSIPGGAVTVYRDGELADIDEEIFERYLSIGTVPVTFGDVSIDEERGVTICSGDDIMGALAHMADRAVFVADVDGIYKDKELVREFSEEMLPLEDNDHPSMRGAVDVTGGMNGKARIMVNMSDSCSVSLVNGTKKGRLEALLRGEDPVHTEVKR